MHLMAQIGRLIDRCDVDEEICTIFYAEEEATELGPPRRRMGLS